MTRCPGIPWALLLASVTWFVWSGCLEVETQFCGDVLCPRGLVCSIALDNTCVLPRQRTCGDGEVDDGEVCDDAGKHGSDDECSDDCQSDLSCGNGIVDPGEDCDCGWNLDIAGNAYVSDECNKRPNGVDGGFCNASCGMFCGDGVAADQELCDGIDLRGFSCTKFGFDAGELQCARCAFNTHGCERIGWYLDNETQSTTIPLLQAVHGVELPNAQGDMVAHVFAVGGQGLFWIYDGENWRSINAGTAGTTGLSAVFAAAPDNVYLAGAEGVIARYDGQRVVVEHRDTSGDRVVSVWAGGNNPLALTETGRLWQRTMITGTNASDREVDVVWKRILKLSPMSAMWVLDDGDFFVLSASGNVYHYVNNVLRETLSDARYRALFGHGQTLIAVGDDGVVQRYEGGAWRQTREILPGRPNLSAVFGRDLANVVAVGDDGACFSWNGRAWRRLDTRPKAEGADEWYQPQRFAGVWMSSAGAVFAVDSNGQATHRGVWRYDGTEWVVHDPAPDTSSLRGVWGTPGGALHALNANGYHLYYDGAVWAQPRPVASASESISLNALVGRDAGEVLFAVGDDGAAFLYRQDSETWTQLAQVRSAFMDSPAPDFHAAWTSPDGVLFMVGTDGWALRCQDDGATCAAPIQVAPESGHDQVTLTAVWGRSSDEVYVVSDNGVVYEFDAGGLVGKYSNYLPPLTGLSGAGDVIFAVGRAGTVIRRQGSESWDKPAPVPNNRVELRAVFALAGDRAYAAGDGGALWRYNGAAWLPVNSFTHEPLNAVSSTGDTLVVGRGDGTLATLTLSEK